MTRPHRLERLEDSLSPTQLALRWLVEAHANGDLERQGALSRRSRGPLSRHS